jgi:F-box associated protein
MLTSLAPETLCLILDYLSTRDLLSLRATSKAFLHVTRRVFSDVTFSLQHVRTHQQLRCFQALSNPSCTIAPHVIRLCIENLGNLRKILDEADELVRIVLSQHFPSFISKMRSLKTVW